MVSYLMVVVNAITVNKSSKPDYISLCLLQAEGYFIYKHQSAC